MSADLPKRVDSPKIRGDFAQNEGGGGLIPAEVVARVGDGVGLADDLKGFLDEPKAESAWWPVRFWLVEYSFARLRPGTSPYMEALACRQWLAFCLRYLSALLTHRERAYTAEMVANVMQNDVRAVDTLLFDDQAACIRVLQSVYREPLSEEAAPERGALAVKLRDEVQAQVGSARTVTIWTQKVVEQLAACIVADLSAPTADTVSPVVLNDNLTYSAQFDALLAAAQAGRADYALQQRVARQRADFLYQRDQLRVTGRRLLRFTLVSLSVALLLLASGSSVTAAAGVVVLAVVSACYVLYLASAGLLYALTRAQLRDLAERLGV